MSAFVWLDYSEREPRKMLDVVDLFKEHDTRDELGLAAINFCSSRGRIRDWNGSGSRRRACPTARDALKRT
jgi:hypothetical protein